MFSPLKSSIAAVIIGASIIPAGLFVSPVEANSSMASLDAVVAVETPMPVVPATSPISINVVIPGSTACNLSPTAGLNLVQDTGLINFNQPANCFTIGNARLSLPEQLAVTSAASSVTISVRDSERISWNEFQPAPTLPIAAPALPVISLALLILAAAFTFEPAKRKWQRKIINLPQTLTFSQLQVMRC